MRVQQRLRRHAHAKTALKYGDALDKSKRKANQKVVKFVFGGPTCGNVPFCSLASLWNQR